MLGRWSGRMALRILERFMKGIISSGPKQVIKKNPGGKRTKDRFLAFAAHVPQAGLIAFGINLKRLGLKRGKPESRFGFGFANLAQDAGLMPVGVIQLGLDPNFCFFIP